MMTWFITVCVGCQSAPSRTIASDSPQLDSQRARGPNPAQIPINISGLPQNDSQELASHIRRMLQEIDGPLLIPESIEVENGTRNPVFQGPNWLSLNIPFRWVLSSGKVLEKRSLAESLGVNLHELGHGIYDTFVRRQMADRPEVAWAFAKPGVSDQEIDVTKSKSRFKNEPTNVLSDRFASFAEFIPAYDELFADIAAVLYLKDPDCIYNSITFDLHGVDVAKEDANMMDMNRYRRFDIDFDFQDWEARANQSAYVAFAPVKTFVWREIYSKYYLQNKDRISIGDIELRILNAIVKSFERLTANFTSADIYSKLSFKERNEDLIKELKRQFQLPM